MRSRARTLFLLLSIAWIAANVIWTGCAVVPLPSTRHPINSRKLADLKFINRTQPTREEVVAKLGPPDAYLGNLNIACYHIDTVTRRKVFLMFFVIPLSVDRQSETDVALIQFDDTGHAKRYGVMQQRNPNYYELADKWLAQERAKENENRK